MKDEKGWRSEKVKCDLCGFTWIAIYHESCDKLECKNCNNMVYFEIINIINSLTNER